MQLGELLSGAGSTPVPVSCDSQAIDIKDVVVDSRRATTGSLFVAIDGEQTDGHEFVHDAVARGARAVVAERAISPDPDVPQIVVPDTRAAIPALAATFYGRPADQLTMIGITGTDGKTTTSHLTAAILSVAGADVGLLGTICYRTGTRVTAARNTTPGPLVLQELLAEMVQEGCTHCVMEVSSHAVVQKRVDQIHYAAGIFTNISTEHLEYHRTFDNYLAAKSAFLTSLEPDAFAVLNADDEESPAIAKQCAAPVCWYGIQNDAAIKASNLKCTLDGTQFLLEAPDGRVPIQSRLVGNFNVYNALAAAAVSTALGVDLQHIKEGIESFGGMAGRLEKIDCGQEFTVMVDYCHTHRSMQVVLTTLRSLVGEGRILLVFGCGGDRQREKRPKMGAAAATFSDYFIITTDNSRSEKPEDIVKDIEAGTCGKPHDVILDRRQAIRRALELAEPGDLVIIAGKGHERYQLQDGNRQPFDDRQEAREALLLLGRATDRVAVGPDSQVPDQDADPQAAG